MSVDTSPGARWGTFLDPDPALADIDKPHEALDIGILSGHRADLRSFAGVNPIFDDIANAIAAVDIASEDQCSAQHYFDVFRCVHRLREQTRRLRGAAWSGGLRVVDVGVFMGGSASVLAGCVGPLDIHLDLVDIGDHYLRFTYERLRRTFPDAMSRVRMFYGDLPTYAHNVLLSEESMGTLVHHDGAHDFGQVVKDLAALYFVRDRVHGIAIQDTHLRSSDLQFLTFVDCAVHAVFGVDVDHEPLGARYAAGSPLTNPNQYEGNYFLAGKPEGMYISLARNEFRYPHPTMSLRSFLPARAALQRS
jgi:hypothetical protein